MIKILLRDLHQRGGLDLQRAFEDNEISINKDPSGGLNFVFPLPQRHLAALYCHTNTLPAVF
jgi:hypothetical protein